VASFLQHFKNNSCDWLIGPGSHLFQRVASFLPQAVCLFIFLIFLFVLISFREWLHSYLFMATATSEQQVKVLISFREWLHSYLSSDKPGFTSRMTCSHLFQRVASFLLIQTIAVQAARNPGSHLFQRVASFLQDSQIVQVSLSVDTVLISFREWLHSY